MLLTYVVIGAVTIFLVKYLVKYLKFRRAYFKLPSRPNYRYTTGTLHQYPGHNEDGLAFDYSNTEKYIYFHVVWLGPLVPAIFAFHPDVIRPVLKSSAPKSRNSYFSTSYDMGVRWLGEGLLIANGAKWARSRRLLTPAFHFDILRQYVDIYNQCGDLLIARMKETAKSNQSFDLYPLINLDALDIILRCAFSYKSNCQVTNAASDYSTVIGQLQTLWAERAINPFYLNEFIYSLTSKGRKFYQLCDTAHKVAEEIINKRKKELENDSTPVQQHKVKDFLDTLLTARDEEGAGLSLLEIRNEVDTFLFEGHDTTASGMTWTLYSLAQHPENQERVYQEIMDVLQGREQLEWSDLPKLEFTTMCIKEGLRLHAPVPFIERTITEDCNVHGHIIPAGSRVCIQIYALHHNPHVWEDPHEYRPERFHPDDQKKMDPFQFVPFSAGSRNCIGQNFAMNEMKVTICKVIQNFKLSLDPSQTARRMPIVTMKPEKGAFVYATIRE
ncbi:ultra-long-chain fatty acid omega-hydroxylase-like [Biomphalaria glabrata]|uniref:Ultra-long-chain fatty acid omega-hydroxylase-like n=1 Tax=Biomphalaria glabrata TaxID=6526 RepID=A0A9W2YQR2_BIOGL|nr:ultra-long-chain fatty acid omega-hydroxylase-like [Biomphalaria glabrata]KAI8736502.1 cytochrome P450 4F22-like [Biomphalaria glabrata]